MISKSVSWCHFKFYMKHANLDSSESMVGLNSLLNNNYPSKKLPCYELNLI